MAQSPFDLNALRLRRQMLAALLTQVDARIAKAEEQKQAKVLPTPQQTNG